MLIRRTEFFFFFEYIKIPKDAYVISFVHGGNNNGFYSFLSYEVRNPLNPSHDIEIIIQGNISYTDILNANGWVLNLELAQKVCLAHANRGHTVRVIDHGS